MFIVSHILSLYEGRYGSYPKYSTCERHKLYDYACSEGYNIHTDFIDTG
jgi:hypothetical protein